jgi:hypothetical protein
MIKLISAAAAAFVLSCAGSASAAVVVSPSAYGPNFSCVYACADGTEVDFTPGSWPADPALGHYPRWVYSWMQVLTFDVFEISGATPYTNVRFKGGSWGTLENRREEVVGVTDGNGYLRLEGLIFKGNSLLTVGYKPYNLYIDASGISRGVPEPATWAMMIIGFGAVGTSVRRRRSLRLA